MAISGCCVIFGLQISSKLAQFSSIYSRKCFILFWLFRQPAFRQYSPKPAKTGRKRLQNPARRRFRIRLGGELLLRVARMDRFRDCFLELSSCGICDLHARQSASKSTFASSVVQKQIRRLPEKPKSFHPLSYLNILKFK